jgi:L-fuculose-phosphate aldolase
MRSDQEPHVRAEIVRVAQAMDRAGFAPSKSGNVSCRHKAAALITPTGLPYERMQPDDLVEIDIAANAPSDPRASSEWRLHAAVYRARPDVTAIVHTHSPKATALSCARRGIPAFHYMIALAGGADIRCAGYATFGTQELADHVVSALENRKAALLANHGVVAVGASLASAHAIAVEVENLAAQYLTLCAARLEPVILDEDEMARVAARFADYGKPG